MLIVLALFLGGAALQCADASVLIHIHALNANNRARGGGERVMSYDQSSNSIKLWNFKATYNHIIWEKVDIEGSTGFYLYIKNSFNQRLWMSDQRTGYNFKLQMKSITADDPRQVFTFTGNKLYCFGGATYDDGRRYVVHYTEDKVGGAMMCAPEMGNPSEDMAIESIRNAKIAGAQFFIVNRKDVYSKLTMLGRDPSDIGFRQNNYNSKHLWQFEEDTAHRNLYYIKPVTEMDFQIFGRNCEINCVRFYSGNRHVDQQFRLELALDNVGKEWDYYRVIHNLYNRRLVRLDNNKIGIRHVDYPDGHDQHWRLIPRFSAMDGGYQFIARHVGQPHDITESVTYEQGLTLMQGSEVSTTTGITVALEASVEKGPFSATLSTEISHEITTVDTSSSTSSWSEKVQIVRVFPANKDCTLYQRKVNYLSALTSDSLGQTPRDFRMVCKDFHGRK